MTTPELHCVVVPAILLGLLFAPPVVVHAAGAAKQDPNVILILADDLGYGSLGCYGGAKLKTPACDRLAREGRRFTNAYAPGSVCSPSRYALMTGRYMWRSGAGDGVGLGADAPLHIETNRLTLASLTKAQGYRTAAIGKWHLGLGMAAKTDWNAPLTPGPLQVGFDDFFGLAANVNNRPDAYLENGQILDRTPGQLVAIEGTGKEAKTLGISPVRAPDEVMRKLTAKAVKWLEENRARPFFLYFAPNAIHEPVTPAPGFTGSPFGKYGDFIHELDWSVGEVLAALDKHKLADNTLVIFTSDNGGALHVNLTDSMIAVKAGLAVNGQLRDGKGSVWEGGFRVPFIARWPGRVPAGTVCEDIVCLTDVLATLAGVLGAPLPDGAAEDSFDVRTSWFGTARGKPARDSVVLQAAFAAEYGFRQGSWKLVERVNPPPFQTPSKNIGERIMGRRKHWPPHDELFSLADDPSEKKEVSAEHPDVVARMRKSLAEARDKDSTRPGPAPASSVAPEVWMMPPAAPNGACFRELFEHPDEWKETRSSVHVLGYAGQMLHKQFTDDELRAWLPQIEEWGLKLGLEVGAVKPWGTTGRKVFERQRPMWDRIQSLGGKIHALAMDEPLCCVRRDLKKPDEYAVEETAQFVALVRESYPDIRIGDIEPYPFLQVPELIAFIDALQARLKEMGVPGLDFFRLDVDWNHFTIGGRIRPGNWPDVKQLELACRQRRLPFSLIYWAADYGPMRRLGIADDSTWYVGVMRQGYDYLFVGGAPDQYVIESWVGAPTCSVPETGEWTFTRSVRDFTRKFVK